MLSLTLPGAVSTAGNGSVTVAVSSEACLFWWLLAVVQSAFGHVSALLDMTHDPSSAPDTFLMSCSFQEPRGAVSCQL